MPRLKGSKNKPENATERSQAAVHGKDAGPVEPEIVDAPEEPKSSPTEKVTKNVTQRVASKSAFLYHREHPPKVFKAGDPIPDGWEDHLSGLHKHWVQQEDGTFKKA